MRRFVNAAWRYFDRFNYVLTLVAAIMVAVMMVVVCYEIIMRYFLNHPSEWTLPLTEYLLLYMVYLSTTYVLQQKQHVTMDMIVGLVKGRSRVIWEACISGIGAIISLVVTWLTWLQTCDDFSGHVMLITGLDVPLWVISVVIPVSMMLLSIQFARDCFNKFNSLSKKRSSGNVIASAEGGV